MIHGEFQSSTGKVNTLLPVFEAYISIRALGVDKERVPVVMDTGSDRTTITASFAYRVMHIDPAILPVTERQFGIRGFIEVHVVKALIEFPDTDHGHVGYERDIAIEIPQGDSYKTGFTAPLLGKDIMLEWRIVFDATHKPDGLLTAEPFNYTSTRS